MDIQASNVVSTIGPNHLNGSSPLRPQPAGTSRTEPLPAAGKAPATQGEPVSKQALQDAVATTNQFVKNVTNAVEFSIDKDSGDTVVKVVDTATKEVIRQYPSEEMLTIAKALDKIQGLLIKQKA